jgi:hypothetical protein
MPYNPPHDKYLKQWLIFLALVILGPKESKKQINIFLHPLMEELKELWQGIVVTATLIIVIRTLTMHQIHGLIKLKSK